jgi:excisionase family DNA binding protein
LISDIRQLTDVFECNLQHYLSRNWHQTSRRTVTGNVSSLASARFLTVFEAATILRVSKQTVYRLVRDGDLEAIRVGRSFRIPAHAVRPGTAAVPRVTGGR